MSEISTAGPPQGTPQLEVKEGLRAIIGHADDNMILAQRLGELISRAPDLELDIALGNIALDHLGVARALYTHAGQLEGRGRTEDDFAMRRTEREFSNLLLVEQPNGDFADTIVRQCFFDIYQRLLWRRLSSSEDRALAGIAARASKENAYHLEFSQSWLTRLGDGTDESHRRAQDAVDRLWRFTGELVEEVGEEWLSGATGAIERATLTVPDDEYRRSGGRNGFHTEHLGYLLAEMQWMDRTYPGMEW